MAGRQLQGAGKFKREGETSMFSTNKINIVRDNGTEMEAAAPVILSASVATDIPAYHSNWFFKRIDAGYARRMNVFSHKDVFVSFRDARLVVFWTKNAAPMMSKLHELDNETQSIQVSPTSDDIHPFCKALCLGFLTNTIILSK
jgi:hypothetical protein